MSPFTSSGKIKNDLRNMVASRSLSQRQDEEHGRRASPASVGTWYASRNNLTDKMSYCSPLTKG